MIQLENILIREEKVAAQRVTIDLPQSQHAKLMRLCRHYDVKMVDIFRSLIDSIEEPVYSEELEMQQ